MYKEEENNKTKQKTQQQQQQQQKEEEEEEEEGEGKEVLFCSNLNSSGRSYVRSLVYKENQKRAG